MWFAYDTEQYASVLIPVVDKLLGSAVDANLEVMNSAATPGPLPVTYNASDFEPFDFDFTGDINLNAVEEVWLDPAHTQLKPGVYQTTGTLTLNNQDVRGQVTFIARDIVLRNSGTRLTPFLGGVLFFATGVAPSGLSVKISGSDHLLTGVIFAPQGPVEIKASRLIIDGSIFCNGFDWPGSKSRIAFNPDLFQT